MTKDQAALLRSIDEVIGMYLLLLRLEGRMGENAVCDRLDISPARLRSYERGECAIPASKLYLFAEMAEVKMDFFFMDLIGRIARSGGV